MEGFTRNGEHARSISRGFLGIPRLFSCWMKRSKTFSRTTDMSREETEEVVGGGKITAGKCEGQDRALHATSSTRDLNLQDAQQPSEGEHTNNTLEEASFGEYFNGEPIPVPQSPQDIGQEIKRQVGELCRQAKNFYPKLMGYSTNNVTDKGVLDDIIGLYLNNVGDPFVGKIHIANTKRFEVGVLEWFAALWHIHPKDMWGYITNGGTEGNLHGLLMARDKLPNGILYSSVHAHYSIDKAAHILRLPLEQVEIQENGEIDYSELERRLKKNAGVPAIISANIGSTMMGAIDDVDRIADILHKCGYSRKDYYIHCDAALSGIMLPFLDTQAAPSFNKPIDSLSVSGHKFLGCPFPCGVFMTRKSMKEGLDSHFDYVEYVRTSDTTISGSRNGHAAVHLWYLLAMKGCAGIKQEALECVRKAEILKGMLDVYGIECSLNENSNTVVFPCPSQKVLGKWGVAHLGSKAHVVIMQHVSVDKLKELAVDLARELAPNSTLE